MKRKEDDPFFWFKVDPKEFLSDGLISAMNAIEFGCATRLLMHQWIEGHITDDLAILARVCRLTLPEMQEAWPIVGQFFPEIEPGKRANRFMYSQRQVLNAEREHKQGAGRGAVKKRWGSDISPCGSESRSQRLAEARKKATHTPEEWSAMLAFCGEQCLRCGAVNCKFVKDHITPIYQGGSDGIENIQPLCSKCNSSKGPESTDYRPDGWKNACGKPTERLPKATESLQESETETESDKEQEQKPLSIPSTAPAVKSADVVAIWNEATQGKLPQAKSTPKRQTVIQTRLKEPGWLPDFRAACAFLAVTAWYAGANDRGWVATLDYALQAGKATELAEKATQTPRENGSGTTKPSVTSQRVANNRAALAKAAERFGWANPDGADSANGRSLPEPRPDGLAGGVLVGFPATGPEILPPESHSGPGGTQAHTGAELLSAAR